MPLPYEAPDKTDLLNLYGGEFSSGYQGLTAQRLNQVQQVADLYQKQQAQAVDQNAESIRHDKVMNPFKEQRAPLEIEDLVQRNRSSKRENDFQDRIDPQRFDEFVAKNRGSIQKEHLEEMNRLGQVMMQTHAQVGNITDPVMRNLRAKQLFEQSGFGDRFDDSIDASKFGDIGRAMLLANSKAQQAFGLQENKDDAAMERERLRAASKERIAKLTADAKAAVSRVQKMKPEQQPKNYQALSVKWNQDATIAAAEGREEDAAYLRSLSQQALAAAAQLLQIQAQARNAGQVDPGAVSGLPTLPPPQTPTVPQPVVRQPPVQTPKPQPTANPATATRPIRQKLQEQGMPYEPDKYEYAIDSDGDVVRRAKRK